MTNTRIISRWHIRISRGRYDLWFRYRPSTDGEIYTQTFGLTICRIEQKNFGERADHFRALELVGWYFGTRIGRRDHLKESPHG